MSPRSNILQANEFSPIVVDPIVETSINETSLLLSKRCEKRILSETCAVFGLNLRCSGANHPYKSAGGSRRSEREGQAGTLNARR